MNDKEYEEAKKYLEKEQELLETRLQRDLDREMVQTMKKMHERLLGI